MQSHRTQAGGLIDRARPITFTFDGRSYEGYEGDTLASALLANGVTLVGRSFKYHRPRGILTAGPEEPNALVELRDGAAREPNTRATIAELFSGLSARSQNRFPSLEHDLLAINTLFAPIFGAGFYYKTFMWPAAFWERVYEPLIRRAAGLGRASGLPDPDTYETQTAHADILIIGAGPAGLAAALEAAQTGARIILAEQDFALGGRLLSDRHTINGQPAAAWLQDTEAKLRGSANIRILTRTTVTGVFDGPTYGALERVSDHLPNVGSGPRQRHWRLIADKAILATGAIERPLIFANNDLPGIMLAGAVRTFVNRFGVKPGTRAVVFTNNDDGAGTIADLHAAGVTVAALIDARPEIPQAIRDFAAAQNIAVHTNATILKATGGTSVKSVTLGGAAAGTTLACDLVAMSGGWNPAVHLASHHGGKPIFNEQIAAFTPGPLPPGLHPAGAADGHFLLADTLATGKAAARAVLQLPPVPPDNLTTGEDFAGITAFWQVPHANTKKSFVDFQNDVTASDIALAAAEGFTAVEHLKRYTTLGMATDQGKTSNVTGLAIMASLTHRTIAATGTTVFRPPYTPTAIGALAGPHRGPSYRPTRRTPAHGWAAAQGAPFVDAGEWLRATHFPKPGESMAEAINREVLTVRQSVGFCDVTTLGKIDVQGPDAAAFLDFVYSNLISTLAPGRIRYGLMLREDGFVFDDGTVARLSQTHFLITTSTAHAGSVLRHLDHAHHILRPELDLCIEPVTDQWAQFAVAGPQARAILQKLVGPRTDISDSAIPFMATTTAELCGTHRARIFRISFSGELAYELAVPAAQGAALAAALQDAGATPYGLEALNVLRLEKGFLVGAELNGQTTAADLGLGGMLSKKKDFIGRVLSRRPALLAPDRATLVGLRPTKPGAVLQAGAHLIPAGAEAIAANDHGYITSAAYSATLGSWIALALVSAGATRMGQHYRAVNPLQDTEAVVEIVPRVFHDPEGKSLHV
jgi:sarcosine oxidase subunit alpha